MDNEVDAIAVVGSDVYVGGGFTLAGGTPASCIAKWTGSGWYPLGSGTNTFIRTLVPLASRARMVVGGDFGIAGDLNALGIAEFADAENPVLPIQLASFTGTYVNNAVQLHWMTLSEINNYGLPARTLPAKPHT